MITTSIIQREKRENSLKKRVTSTTQITKNKHESPVVTPAKKQTNK